MKKKVGNNLEKLALLRTKADYKPFEELNYKEVEDAISYMETIFNDLKFE